MSKRQKNLLVIKQKIFSCSQTCNNAGWNVKMKATLRKRTVLNRREVEREGETQNEQLRGRMERERERARDKRR